MWQLYYGSPSLVIVAVAFGIAWAPARRPMLEMLGWVLHILIDIPTQRIFALHFLWPFSSYGISRLSVGERLVYGFELRVLALVYSWLWVSAAAA